MWNNRYIDEFSWAVVSGGLLTRLNVGRRLSLRSASWEKADDSDTIDAKRREYVNHEAFLQFRPYLSLSLSRRACSSGAKPRKNLSLFHRLSIQVCTRRATSAMEVSGNNDVLLHARILLQETVDLSWWGLLLWKMHSSSCSDLTTLSVQLSSDYSFFCSVTMSCNLH